MAFMEFSKKRHLHVKVCFVARSLLGRVGKGKEKVTGSCGVVCLGGGVWSQNVVNYAKERVCKYIFTYYFSFLG